MDTVLTLSSFRKHMHTRFRIQAELDVTAELELLEAVDLGSTAHQEQFSVVFRGPHDLLPQGIYRLEHDILGSLHLFLVPVERNQSGILYEAAFCRLNTTGA